MRVWDISPGYLNRQSLLGEHRELHGIVSIITNNKKGYARHPETMRWVGYGWALRKRHGLLAAEMSLRGYTDKTPVKTRSNRGNWPDVYVDEPYEQLMRLNEKYADKEHGRIPLPKNCQQLWSHHKYSVMARSQEMYKEIGSKVAKKGRISFQELALLLTEMLRAEPSPGGLLNALQHMWGHVSDIAPPLKGGFEKWAPTRLLAEIQKRVVESKESYLSKSTALSEMRVWLP